MPDTPSTHKGTYTLGNKTLLVGTERADAATSCPVSMTMVQRPVQELPKTQLAPASDKLCVEAQPTRKRDERGHEGTGQSDRPRAVPRVEGEDSTAHPNSDPSSPANSLPPSRSSSACPYPPQAKQYGGNRERNR